MPPDPSAVPGPGADPSLPRIVLVLLAMAGAVVVVVGMWAFRGILGPVLLALMLTIVVSPIAWRLMARGWPSWLAMLVALVTVYGIVAFLVVTITVSLAQLVALLPTYADQFDDLTASISDLLTSLGVGEGQAATALTQADLGAIVGVLESVLAGLLGVLSNVAFLLAVLLFMGMDAIRFPERHRAAVALDPNAVSGLTAFATGTRSYLVVSTIFGGIVAVIDALALWLLGIPLPILWGLLSFITSYIPNIGFVIGVIPPALIALLEGGVGLMLVVIALYSVVNFFIQSVIQPKIVGDVVGLAVTVTFLSLAFWTFVIGPLGALLAVPLTLLAKGVLVDTDPAMRWLVPLIAGSPARPEAPPEDPAEEPEALPDVVRQVDEPPDVADPVSAG